MKTEEIFFKMMELQDEINSMTLLGSPHYDGIPSGTRISDMTASKALARATLYEDYMNASETFLARLSVLTENERTVYLGKLNGKTTAQLAEQLFYSEAYIYKLWLIANRKVN